MRKFYRLNAYYILDNIFHGKDFSTIMRKFTACLWSQGIGIKLDANGFSKEFKVAFDEKEYGSFDEYPNYQLKLIKSSDRWAKAPFLYREWILL